MANFRILIIEGDGASVIDALEKALAGRPTTPAMLAKPAPDPLPLPLDPMPPTMKRICEAVCQQYEVTPRRVVGFSRSRGVTWARMVTAYLTRTHTRMSFQDIGNSLDRHHTSIIHAVNTVGLRMLNDDSFAAEIHQLVNTLGLENPKEAA